MWSRLIIEDETQAWIVGERIRESVKVDAIAKGLKDAAAFYMMDDDGRSIFHFTPQAFVVAQMYSAVLVATPDRKDLGRIVCGDKAILQRLFG